MEFDASLLTAAKVENLLRLLRALRTPPPVRRRSDDDFRYRLRVARRVLDALDLEREVEQLTAAASQGRSAG